MCWSTPRRPRTAPTPVSSPRAAAAALVVARRNASRVGALQDLVGSLNDATVQVAGVVMNEW
jgi:hypothetical protein